MKGIFKFFSIAAILIIYSCGSFQTKSNNSLAKKTGDSNDEFFDDETPSFFSGKPKKTDKAGEIKKTDNMGKEAKFEKTELSSGNAKSSEFKEADTITDVARGYASWYGKELQNKPTASGDLFDMNKFTAAHRTFPMGSLVLVRNLENGKKKLVRINDRGPYVDGRVIDVSYAVARDLGFAEKGVARVEVELIEKSENNFIAKSENDNAEVKEDPSNESVNESDDVAGEDVEKLSDKDGYTFHDGIRPQNYTVRTGAFKVSQNAEKYKEHLEDKYNVNAFIGKKGKWNFVWIGDFENKDKAEKFYHKLKTDGLDVITPKKVP
ncbi:MAG: septal ring lytic transglycosylase RlpA family protein [Spirochaetia bacterium]|nr:septal ring lytic transglycosylase RlpA family protein [Spirochaetia bacterium]